jgi:hypothetical protein
MEIVIQIFCTFAGALIFYLCSDIYHMWRAEHCRSLIDLKELGEDVEGVIRRRLVSRWNGHRDHFPLSECGSRGSW